MVVRYTPSVSGRGQLVMTPLAGLVRNSICLVTDIVEIEYLVLQGYEASVPNTIHWTEFSPL